MNELKVKYLEAFGVQNFGRWTFYIPSFLPFLICCFCTSHSLDLSFLFPCQLLTGKKNIKVILETVLFSEPFDYLKL